MIHRVTVIPFLFAVIAIITTVFAGGCTPVLTGSKYDYTFLTDSNLTPDEKKIEWQKMKKWRISQGQ